MLHISPTISTNSTQSNQTKPVQITVINSSSNQQNINIHQSIQQNESQQQVPQKQFKSNLAEVNRQLEKMDSIYQQRRIQLAKENELNNFLKQQQSVLQQQANETDNFNIEKCESQTRQIIENKQNRYNEVSKQLYEIKYNEVLNYDLTIDYEKFSLIEVKPSPPHSPVNIHLPPIKREEIKIEKKPYDGIEINISLEKYIETKKHYLIKKIFKDTNVIIDSKNPFPQFNEDFNQDHYKKSKKNVEHYCYFFQTTTGNVYGFELETQGKANKKVLSFKFFSILPTFKIIDEIVSSNDDYDGIQFNLNDEIESNSEPMILEFQSKTLKNIHPSIEKYFPSNEINGMIIWKLRNH